jgi:hypothetical protein
MKRAVTLFCVLLFAPLAHAADNATTGYHEVNRILVHSSNDTIFPTWSGKAQITFATTLVWGTPNVCSTAAVVVHEDDTRLVAALHTAHAQGKPVRLYVDDSQLQGTYCILRAVQY